MHRFALGFLSVMFLIFCGTVLQSQPPALPTTPTTAQATAQPSAQASGAASSDSPTEKFAFALPNFQTLGSRLEDLVKNHPNDPAIPGLLIEAIMAAGLVERKDVEASMLEILYLKYPDTLQSAYLRKTGGWRRLFQTFIGRFSDRINPLEPADMERMKRVMASMIKENGVDWTDETTLFYGILFDFPVSNEKNLASFLSTSKSKSLRASRILKEKGLSAKDKIVDLGEFTGEPVLRGLQRYYYKFQLKEEERQSKLVAIAIARGYFEECRFDKAREVLGLSANQNDAEVQFYLAWASAMEGKYQEAKQAIEAIDPNKAPAAIKERISPLLEAIGDDKDAGLTFRADLTRAFTEFGGRFPKAFAVRIQLNHAARGDRVLFFHCDTAEESFRMAILDKEKVEKPVFLYRTGASGTRYFRQEDKDIRETPLTGIVPIFSIEPGPWGISVQFQTRELGKRATAESLEQISQKKWFVPAFLGDYIARTIHAWGWLALTPEESEEGETLAWVRPSLQSNAMERCELRFDAKNRFKSFGFNGDYLLEFLLFDEEAKAKAQLDQLWPQLPVTQTSNHTEIDKKNLPAVLAQFQNWKNDAAPSSPAGK